MRLLEALPHVFYNGQITFHKYLQNDIISEFVMTIEVLNTTKDIERKEAQKEKQNMNMFHYRDILQKQYRKKKLYSMLGHNGQDVPKSI